MLISTMIMWLVAALIMITPFCVHAEVYKYVDDTGVLCISDVPQPNATAVKGSEDTIVPKPRPKLDIHTIIHNKASKYSLDPSLVKAVIKVESNFNERAVSNKGALGLMQVMPTTAMDMGVYNPMNPEQNIEAGTKYLRYLLERFDGDLRLALAAYNAGPQNVEKYGTVPPIKETKSYLKKIFSIYDAGNNGYRVNNANPIYKIVLTDGTMLFTDSMPSMNQQSSR